MQWVHVLSFEMRNSPCKTTSISRFTTSNVFHGCTISSSAPVGTFVVRVFLIKQLDWDKCNRSEASRTSPAFYDKVNFVPYSMIWDKNEINDPKSTAQHRWKHRSAPVAPLSTTRLTWCDHSLQCPPRHKTLYCHSHFFILIGNIAACFWGVKQFRY